MQYKEWLLTNRFGAFSFGTSTGCVYKPEHALFTAVLRPPLRRKICIRHFQDDIYINHNWRPITKSLDAESESPPAIPGLEFEFRMENYLPAFIYSTAQFVIKKRIWLPQSMDAVFVQYSVENALEPCRLRVQPYLNIDDDFFSSTFSEPPLKMSPGGFKFQIEREEKKWLHFSTDRRTAAVAINNFAQLNFADSQTHPQEKCYVPAALSFILKQGETATIRAGLNETAEFDANDAYQSTVQQGGKPFFVDFPAGQGQESLILACNANAFQLERPTETALENQSLAATYPAGVDHARTTLLSIPGLLIGPGNYDAMKNMLEMLKRHMKKNALPNRFFEDITPPTYDSADNALWMFHIAYTYWRESQDKEFLEQNYPFLIKLLENHISGTENGVKMDSEDGLLEIIDGASGLTWMDQKFGEWPVTPRYGKPVEIQALWYNALRVAFEFSKLLGRRTGAEKTRSFLERAHHSMLKKFWVNELKYLVDVVSKDGIDTTFRANQIIALGLSFTPFSNEQISSVVSKARKLLVTPYGLRTLTPQHPAYRGGAPKSPQEIAGAWHNGVIHPWLTWPFLQASLRCGVPALELFKIFQPLFASVNDGVIGHVYEAYTGDAPHKPVGAPASAVSLGALIQCAKLLKSQMQG